MKRPVIIGTVSEQGVVVRKLTLGRTYIDTIEQAGGIILATGKPKDEESIHAIAELADGLLLTGGHDVCPEFYKEESRNCKHIDRERDDFELAVFKCMVALNKPVLGICRGMQVMNVAMEGTLYQDVFTEMPGAIQHDYHFDKNGIALARDRSAHGIQIVPGTLLHRLYGTTTSAVNSLHHQGLKTLGKNLTASAFAPDGLIEAIEISGHPFALGIEWHPEELSDSASQKIFSAFIDAARLNKFTPWSAQQGSNLRPSA